MELKREQQLLKSSLIARYYEHANEREKRWVRDNAAALRIQSMFRMYVRRKAFLKMRAAAVSIQTLFRAHSARRHFRKQAAAHANHRNFMYFSQQAVVIQKWFRGFFQRKYKHNFYQRKKELIALQIKNEEFRLQLQAFGHLQAREAEEYEQNLAKAEFTALARNLHHLTSTKNIPGVYNSPFVAPPTVFDKTVQTHLQQVFKEGYKGKKQPLATH